ncbi:NAD(P)/FAD-dependent oxidoreductase [Azospirillum sp. CT11-132]|uniref:NAD(P)/FAD-dependent oxidoreductase n=1 Tax=Azospirillum sp. CT11-132 TaxID=3396317 RepID=UPI0039A47D49
MHEITRLPADDSTNGWSRILPRRTPRPSLDGHIRADWVVVGAGYAGLAAARRLAENRPHQTVVVLEAQQAGEGASGRNSGFAIDLPHTVGSSLEELESSHRSMNLARAGIAYLKRQVDGHGIACDWSLRGKYHAAVSEKGVAEVLTPLAKELDALGEPYRWVDRDALRKDLGSPHFSAAIHTPGCVLLNPAALCRGLADSLPANVRLHENTPVTQVDYRNGVTLTTPGGSVSAPKMILAVNGFAEKFGFYKRRLLVFAAHASLSRPLSPDERAALGGVENWGLTPANAFAGITMRRTSDHRILIRQNIHFCPGFRQSDERRRAIGAGHKRLFDQRFPMLPDVGMEHTWTGYICLSRNGAPGFARVAPDVYAAVCQNGVGVAKGTIGGVLAADMACGEDNPLIADMESLGAPTGLPPRPFLDLGVRSRFAWELWRARAEA